MNRAFMESCFLHQRLEVSLLVSELTFHPSDLNRLERVASEAGQLGNCGLQLPSKCKQICPLTSERLDSVEDGDTVSSSVVSNTGISARLPHGELRQFGVTGDK